MQPVNQYTGVVSAHLSPPGPPPIRPSGRPPAEQRVPPVVEDFLNTVDERSFSRHGVQHAGGDELATAAALAGWLAGHGLAAPGTPADAGDLAAAIGLRAALRASLEVRAGGQPADGDLLRSVNEVLARHPLRLELEPDGRLRLSARTPEAPGAPTAGQAIAGIAAIVAASAASGTWYRLRICAAPDCRWVFHDTSRSGAGRWCSMAACGNRDKTRRYRKRHPAAARTAGRS